MSRDLCPHCFETKSGYGDNYKDIFKKIHELDGGPLVRPNIGSTASNRLVQLCRWGYVLIEPAGGKRIGRDCYLTSKGISFLKDAGFDISRIIERIQTKYGVIKAQGPAKEQVKVIFGQKGAIS